MTFDHDPPRPAPAAPPLVPPAPAGAELVPMRPAPSTYPPAAAPAQPLPAGWYPEPGKPGVLRYWNGASWEDWRQPAVAAPTVAQAGKSTGAAYVLAIFLGHFGAHNFYLGRTGPAVAQLLLWVVTFVTIWFLIGFIPLIALGIWWIVDLCCIPTYIQQANARAAVSPV